MERINKIVRILTVAPIQAIILILTLFFAAPQYGITGWQAFFSILFLAVLPALAYPLQRFMPHFKDKGRKGQRDLAIVFSVAGYVCGIIYTLVLQPHRVLAVVYLTYLLSGIAIALFSALTPIKASGHACGIVGPMVTICRYVSWWGLVLLVFYAMAFVSSLQMKRHTWQEFLAGSAIPVAALFISEWLVGLAVR